LDGVQYGTNKYTGLNQIFLGTVDAWNE